ncbi:hypothetical protein [Sphingomonas sp. CCH9-E2]|uniref:hypothetical protein n=1 Tax=Sphingomonas sp. CCH9-E2 TaxID=1768776 RepID=UPI0018D23DCF|nr:hypothetical protein [Sphingomonas sp. CCH9-E2]
MALGFLALELAADAPVRDGLDPVAMRLQLRAPHALGIVLALHEIWTDLGKAGMIGPGHVRQRLGPWRILRPVREPAPLPFWLARTFLSLIFHWGMVAPPSNAIPVE